MTLFAELISSKGPIYKKYRPKDKAIFIANGNTSIVLHYIGPGIEYEIEGGGIIDVFDVEPGVWIWEGKVNYVKDYWIDEYDCEINGSTRMLTGKEMEDLAHDMLPWDEDDYFEKELLNE